MADSRACWTEGSRSVKVTWKWGENESFASFGGEEDGLKRVCIPPTLPISKTGFWGIPLIGSQLITWILPASVAVRAEAACLFLFHILVTSI